MTLILKLYRVIRNFDRESFWLNVKLTSKAYEILSKKFTKLVNNHSVGILVLKTIHWRPRILENYDVEVFVVDEN